MLPTAMKGKNHKSRDACRKVTSELDPRLEKQPEVAHLFLCRYDFTSMNKVYVFIYAIV